MDKEKKEEGKVPEPSIGEGKNEEPNKETSNEMIVSETKKESEAAIDPSQVDKKENDFSEGEKDIIKEREDPNMESDSKMEAESAEEEEETEEDIEFYEKLRIEEKDLIKYRNPFETKIFTHWREDLKDLEGSVILDQRNVPSVLQNLVDEKIFVVVYEETYGRHREIVDLLTDLQEPFQLISVEVLKANLETSDFWLANLEPHASPPFVIYEDRIYKQLKSLEYLLYRNLVSHKGRLRMEPVADDEFDLVVLGSAISSCYAAEEASKFSSKVLFIQCFPDCRSSTNIMKMIMYNAIKTFEKIRMGHRFAFCLTDIVHLDWPSIRKVMEDALEKYDRAKRKALNRIKMTIGKAKFVEKEKLKIVSDDSEFNDRIIKSKYYIIATGSSTTIPKDIIGLKNNAIQVEKVFSMKNCPSDALIIGNSPEGMECAGMLSAFEIPVTVVTGPGMQEYPSYEVSFLNEIRKKMETHGVRFIEDCRILRVSASGKNRKLVEGLFSDGSVFKEDYHTVIVALAHSPNTAYLGLNNAGVKLSTSRHIVVDEWDGTNRPNIFALGSVVEGRPYSEKLHETAARYLVQRLFNHGTEKVQYGLIPETILSFPEYSCLGLTEKQAEKLLDGKNKIYVYECSNKQLYDFSMKNNIRVKLLSMEENNGDQVIIGLHLLGEGGGELMQGLSVIFDRKRTLDLEFGRILSTLLSKNILEDLVLTRTLPIAETEADINMNKVEKLIETINTGKHGAEAEEEIKLDQTQLQIEKAMILSAEKVPEDNTEHWICISDKSQPHLREELVNEFLLYCSSKGSSSDSSTSASSSYESEEKTECENDVTDKQEDEIEVTGKQEDEKEVTGKQEDEIEDTGKQEDEKEVAEEQEEEAIAESERKASENEENTKQSNITVE